MAKVLPASQVMRLALGILLFIAASFAGAIAAQTSEPTLVRCRVYTSPSKSQLRLFYDDGRYAWVVTHLKKYKDGTVSADEPEDYALRTGTWKMSDKGMESHEFWVHTGMKVTPPLAPVFEHYGLQNASTLQTSGILDLHDPVGFLNRIFGKQRLILVKLRDLNRLHSLVLSDTCTHAQESPQDVAQEWLKFCEQ
jgi:hypothetical protein